MLRGTVSRQFIWQYGSKDDNSKNWISRSLKSHGLHKLINVISCKNVPRQSTQDFLFCQTWPLSLLVFWMGHFYLIKKLLLHRQSTQHKLTNTHTIPLISSRNYFCSNLTVLIQKRVWICPHLWLFFCIVYFTFYIICIFWRQYRYVYICYHTGNCTFTSSDYYYTVLHDAYVFNQKYSWDIWQMESESET